MKSIKLLYLFAVVLITSCSTDNASYDNLYEGDGALTAPINPNNPYDFIGALYVESIKNFTALDDIEKYNASKLFDIHSRMSDEDGVVEDPFTAFSDLVYQSQLTLAAQESVIDFALAVLDYNPGEYTELYSFIIDYETQILNSEGYNSEDKRIILSFSSIIRYAIYQNDSIQILSEDDDEDDEGAADEDWDIDMGNFYGWLASVLNDEIQ